MSTGKDVFVSTASAAGTSNDLAQSSSRDVPRESSDFSSDATSTHAMAVSLGANPGVSIIPSPLDTCTAVAHTPQDKTSVPSHKPRQQNEDGQKNINPHQKKNKGNASKNQKSNVDHAPRAFPNQDVFIRMNYLFQASHYISTVASSTGKVGLHDLSSFYSHTAYKISQRTVCRLAPATKKLVCKRCHAYLLAGATATVRVERPEQVSLEVSPARQKVLAARRERKRQRRAGQLQNGSDLVTLITPGETFEFPATKHTDTLSSEGSVDVSDKLCAGGADNYNGNKMGIVRVIWTCNRCKFNNVRIRSDASDASDWGASLGDDSLV